MASRFYPEENQSLGNSSNAHRKYGSTETNRFNNESYIKHLVRPGDTLQGIALKYSTSMEQIKRVNMIWTSDSLFLRDFILIPCDVASPAASAACTPTGECDGIVTKLDILMSRRTHPPPLTSLAEDKECDISASDFLSKFDTNLAKIKSHVQELDATSSFPEDTGNPLNYLAMRGASQYDSRQRTGSRSSLDMLDASRPRAKTGSRTSLDYPSDTSSSEEAACDKLGRGCHRPLGHSQAATSGSEPDMVFKTSSRRARASLEQLEKQQDEIFQL